MAYLYDSEDIPIELLKEIYKLTLDVKNLKGITWKGGTSTHNVELLAKHFVDYANKNDEFNPPLLLIGSYTYNNPKLHN